MVGTYEELELRIGRGQHTESHVGVLSAAILTALGLVPISLRFEGRSRPWAFTALGAYSFAAAFEAIDRMISIQVTTWAAQRYPDETVFTVWEAFSRFDSGLGLLFYILGFIALGLYGVAMIQTERLIGLGWAFVTVGVIGILLRLVGAAIPGYVFLGTAALGVASWQIGVPGTSTTDETRREP